jgi:hypothetical protein
VTKDRPKAVSKEGYHANMRTIRLAVAALAISAAGCSMTTPFGAIGSPPAISAGTDYIGGRGSQLFPTAEDFVKRTRECMEDMGLSDINERREGKTTHLEAKTVNARKAFITIKPEGENNRVSARFGTLGDEALSRAFLDRLASSVGTIDPGPTDSAEDTQSLLSKPGKKSRALGDHPPTMIDRQLDPGYRDSVIP